MDAGEIFDASDNTVAHLVHVKSRQAGLLMYDEEMTNANARLMAASPALLAACEAAWNCIAELSPTQARVEVAQMLQAALAKAKP